MIFDMNTPYALGSLLSYPDFPFAAQGTPVANETEIIAGSINTTVKIIGQAGIAEGGN